MNIHLSCLMDVFGLVWKDLTPRQKSLVRKDVESMLSDGDGNTFTECATLLKNRIGGPNNLVSYAKTLEAGVKNCG